MSIRHICLAGSLALLGACAVTPAKTAAPAAATVHAPAPVAAPTIAAAPPAMPAATPAPAPAAAPAPMPPTQPITKPAPAAPVAVAPVRPHAIVKRPPTEASGQLAATFKVSGRVALQAARGQDVDPGEQADTTVYFVPAKGGDAAKPGQYSVYTHNRDFSPEAMAVPQGSTVTFVNLDDVRHNVFSVTPGAAFNLGYQGAGEKISHAFTHAGITLVSCNVHHSMELDLLVLPTPYSGKVAADGSFTLRGLPAGPGTLHFWNSRALPVSQLVTLPMTGAVNQRMLAIKPRMSTELNAGGSP
jgi:plastocyanin